MKKTKNDNLNENTKETSKDVIDETCRESIAMDEKEKLNEEKQENFEKGDYIFIVHILPCALTAEPFTVPPAFYMYALLIISQILSNIIGIDYKQGSKHILFCKTLTGKQFFV